MLQTQVHQNVGVSLGMGQEAGTGVSAGCFGGRGERKVNWLEEGLAK